MLTLLLFAFFSGVITILAPCIWPLLPLLLSASGQEGKKRPLGVVAGIVTSFTLFTLFLSYLLNILPINPDIFRKIAVVIIVILGLTLLIPALNRYLEGLVSQFTGRFGGVAGKKREGFWGGYGNGFFLGILWSPCAGPILAAIATLAATRSVSLEAFFVTLAFAIGVGIPLFVIAALGQRFFTRSRKLSPYTAKIQQMFGAIMILAALAIMFNLDKALQVKLLDSFPSYGSALNFIEESDVVKEKIEILEGYNNESSNPDQILKGKQKSEAIDHLKKAPGFQGNTQWLNAAKPFTIDEFEGNVVLIDFWTYSCINCIRTLPHVTGWYEKYRNDGFVVIGVHTPEFAFEHKTENVEEALERYTITYPVVQDNDYKIWRAYENRYWPAHYLIDAQGNIRYTHFGEGKYEETEQVIQNLLQEAQLLSQKKDLINKNAEGPQRGQTSETYLGYERMERFASPEDVMNDSAKIYSFPSVLEKDTFSFDGEWIVEKERSISGDDAQMKLAFSGSRVFLVMSPPENGEGRIQVYLDGKLINRNVAGTDVKGGRVVVDEERLYELVRLDGVQQHELKLHFESPRVAVYAFTFG